MDRGPDALKTVADYQFGAGAGAALFEGSVSIRRPSACTCCGRPELVRRIETDPSNSAAPAPAPNW